MTAGVVAQVRGRITMVLIVLSLWYAATFKVWRHDSVAKISCALFRSSVQCPVACRDALHCMNTPAASHAHAPCIWFVVDLCISSWNLVRFTVGKYHERRGTAVAHNRSAVQCMW